MDKLPLDRWLSPHSRRLNDLSIPKRLGGGSGGSSRNQWGAGWRGLRTLLEEGCLFLDLHQQSAFVKNRRQSGDAKFESVYRSHFGNAMITEHGCFKGECLVKELLHLGSQAVNRSQSVPEDPGMVQWLSYGRSSYAGTTRSRAWKMTKTNQDKSKPPWTVD